jgi:hypothetical protein
MGLLSLALVLRVISFLGRGFHPVDLIGLPVYVFVGFYWIYLLPRQKRAERANSSLAGEGS